MITYGTTCFNLYIHRWRIPPVVNHTTSTKQILNIKEWARSYSGNATSHISNMHPPSRGPLLHITSIEFSQL